MDFTFLTQDEALALAQDKLPAIAGRGRSAEEYVMPAQVREIGETLATQDEGTCAPILVAPKVEREGKLYAPSDVMNEVRKLNKASRGLGFYFVIRSSEDGTASTVYAVSGVQPEIHRTRKTDDAE